MSASKSKKGTVTASELMSKLQQDQDYLARIRETEQRRQESAREHELATLPIINELKDIGYAVESIDALRRSGAPYKTAIGVLVKWLPLVQNVGVKESIVRALSVPWARPQALSPLLAEFRAIPPTPEANVGIRWTIANAVSVLATDAVFDDLVELLRDKRNGRAREMLAVALGNMKNPRAVDLLIELLDDEEVAGHAIMALGKLKAQKARPYIERFLEHPKAWVRREAKKALAKLDKQHPKPGDR